ncbi:heterokaryon incompatibility protein-domain-containing protein [Chaetomidium leptoderma]|uniref:Heterokaryon incompatibility protein-domain-containing protein n=1 Tax=Chaetomidium leptoderma TaxID=669021 RepID=A0AAN6VC46_9PEZI|nr:heterokaryon incompatibility protein-domain-containing protein [Chaetomidium leptoderma]
MRLINTTTLEFAEFLGTATPPYAILSHTWEDEEVTLREMIDPSPSVACKKGYRKIVDYCSLAARQHHTWAWIDTCCIDKTNHAELAESINSMFRWYQEAEVCHVFLADLPADAELADALPRCRWFTRGWTLQELIAPSTAQFYDQSWTMRGTKANLITQLAAVTGILGPVLDGTLPLHDVSVGVRMSWAANRETTRPEDAAYCLLGIFDVNMPMIYGEGRKAFRRLQEEIIRQSNDLTIFACNHNPSAIMHNPSEMDFADKSLGVAPLLAWSPRDFEMHSTRTSRGPLRTLKPGSIWSEVEPEYVMTNRGLRITASLSFLPNHLDHRDTYGHCVKGRLYFLPLGQIHDGSTDEDDNDVWTFVGMVLTKVRPNVFLRRGTPLSVIPFGVDDRLEACTPPRGFYIEMGDRTFTNRPMVSRRSVIKIREHRHSFPAEANATSPTEGKPNANPSDAEVLVLEGLPCSHWDETSRCFFHGPREYAPFAVSFCVRFKGHGQTFVLCFIDKHLPHDPYIFTLGNHRDLRSRLDSFEAKREYPSSWKELFGKHVGPDWYQRLSSRIVINGVSFSVKTRRMTPEHMDDATYEVSLEVTRHDASTDTTGSDLPQTHLGGVNAEPRHL